MNLLRRVDQISELLEEVCGIIRTGSRFGVVLHAEDRKIAVAHSFDRIVVEVDVGHFDFGWKGIRIDCESMVL